ncbi:MAG: toll/interleukin-1 receptor domain-containing protein [Chloroflexi bacterium]|nr:toll/interleukin-1 receptor domain-containing protein [Chloroflexota bacterium]
MTDFFISYTSADRAWAEWIAWELEHVGYTTTIQAWDFVAGSNFVLEMQRAATECARTIAVLSPNYLAARFTQSEWAAAFAQDPTGEQGKLLPVRVRDFQPDGLFRAIVYIDLVNLDENSARATLLARIKHTRAKPASAPKFPSIPSVPSKFPGVLPAVWNVKPRNPNFTGRETELAQLHNALAATLTAALTQAIHGLGGVGKTQMAIEYAYRHAPEYDLVWWLRAETTMTLAADFAALAQPLNLPEKDERDQRIVMDAVRAHLRQTQRWLLIFDNANAPEDVRDFLPPGGGHVLITSRHSAWRALAAPLTVKPLPRDDAIAFLIKRSGLSPLSAKQTGEGRGGGDAGKLADALGCLPLALTQAAAYIEASGTTFADYLRIFETHRAELLRDPKFKPHDYPDTVATTWTISFNAVAAESPAALTLMNLCAFFAPDEIPLDILVGATHASPLPNDEYALANALIALRKYSLVEKTDMTIAVHRLVQAIVRERMTDDERKMFADTAVRIVDDAFPGGDISTDLDSWQDCARLLTHALAASDFAARLNTTPEATGRLFNQAALYLRTRAQLAEAKQLFERALAIDKATLGPNHPNVATAVNNLGSALIDLGDLPAARQCFERALAIDVAVFGPNHPNVARDVNNLGMVLKDLGDLPAARQRFERALAIDEAIFGPNHPDIATVVNNLGGVNYDLGDLPAARQCLERALMIDEATFGPNHPNVAATVNNLGMVLKDLGDLPAARQYVERALAIDEAIFGPNHPNIAKRVDNLGMVLKDLGDLPAARQHFERALAIDEATFGPNHPNVATVVHNLGMVLKDLGDLPAARQHCERALAIWETSFGTNHPQVAIAVNNLGLVSQYLGDLPVARQCFERAYRICCNTFGEDHTSTIAARINLRGIIVFQKLPRPLRTVLRIVEHTLTGKFAQSINRYSQEAIRKKRTRLLERVNKPK